MRTLPDPPKAWGLDEERAFAGDPREFDRGAHWAREMIRYYEQPCSACHLSNVASVADVYEMARDTRTSGSWIVTDTDDYKAGFNAAIRDIIERKREAGIH